jgi:hypothetical protein
VTFTTIWFWADWHQIRGIASALAPRMILVWALIFAGSTVILSIWEAIQLGVHSAIGAAHPVYSQCLRAALNTAAIIILIATGILLNRPAPDIVYKAF